MAAQYPKMKYSKDSSRTVQSAEEEQQLEGEWYDTPAEVPDAEKDATGFVAAAPFDATPIKQTAPLGEGHTYHDRIVAQAQNCGIRIDKRWSDETLLRKIAEFQPLSKSGIEEANQAVPEDQELDYDPALSKKDREVEEKAAAKIEAQQQAQQ